MLQSVKNLWLKLTRRSLYRQFIRYCEKERGIFLNELYKEEARELCRRREQGIRGVYRSTRGAMPYLHVTALLDSFLKSPRVIEKKYHPTRRTSDYIKDQRRAQ